MLSARFMTMDSNTYGKGAWRDLERISPLMAAALKAATRDGIIFSALWRAAS
jgi:hypothetical protein